MDIPKKEARKKAYQKRKNKVYEHYGNKCGCCGETHREFLTIDHINDRLLCNNCRYARLIYGYCPHEGKHNGNPI